MRFRGALGAVTGAALLILGATLVSGVLATPPPGHKVTICHATNSDTNPYVVIDVDIASSGYVKAGHSDHTGPIWYAGAKDEKVKWGDIIPAYDYAPTTFHYPGLNWTDEGQAIWENDCQIPTETGAPTQSAAVETDEPSGSPFQSVEAETDEPSGTPFQSVAGDTEEPSEPETATSAVGTSAPDSASWLLVVALGVLLGAVMLLTPTRRSMHVER